MHDGSEVIQQDPTGSLAPLYIGGMLPGFRFDVSVDAIGNGPHLCIRVSFANDKKVGRSVVQVSEVKLENSLSLGILYGVYNEVVEFFGCKFFGRVDVSLCVQTLNLDEINKPPSRWRNSIFEYKFKKKYLIAH